MKVLMKLEIEIVQTLALNSVNLLCCHLYGEKNVKCCFKLKHYLKMLVSCTWMVEERIMQVI